MPRRKLKLKAGCKVPFPEKLYEGYAVTESGIIIANVSVDKIEEIMQQFIVMHDVPLYFFLEVPANQDDETEVAPGIVNVLHKDVYYMDGCSYLNMQASTCTCENKLKLKSRRPNRCAY